MSVAGCRDLREPCFSFVDVVHSNGTASEPTTFTGCPRLKGDKFTLSARIRVHWLATHRQACMDIMTWGNVLNASGDRSREFSLRDGALEYGQWDGQCWSAVRPLTGLVADGSWHHLCVTLDGTEVVIYMDGIVCAQGHRGQGISLSIKRMLRRRGEESASGQEIGKSSSRIYEFLWEDQYRGYDGKLKMVNGDIPKISQIEGLTALDKGLLQNY